MLTAQSTIVHLILMVTPKFTALHWVALDTGNVRKVILVKVVVVLILVTGVVVKMRNVTLKIKLQGVRAFQVTKETLTVIACRI